MRSLLPIFVPRVGGWLAPALIVLVAGILRFYNLAHPNAIVFDETYYAKDAYSYVHYGYELSWSRTLMRPLLPVTRRVC